MANPVAPQGAAQQMAAAQMDTPAQAVSWRLAAVAAEGGVPAA